MKRILTAVLMLLVLAPMAAAASIEETTVGEFFDLELVFRNGLITGVFLMLSGSGNFSCPMMTGTILKSGLEAAVQAGEVRKADTLYASVFYVLARSGCVTTPKTRTPIPDLKSSGLLTGAGAGIGFNPDDPGTRRLYDLGFTPILRDPTIGRLPNA